jgi:hypothetical protein
MSALANMIRDGGGGGRWLVELSVRNIGLTCASMLQVFHRVMICPDA